MIMNKEIKKIIISGGGTGGHIFPAIAIANQIKSKYPSADILFVGAKGKMEMNKVPAAGYKIIGLPITGFQRRLTFSNFILPFKLLFSLVKAYFIIKKFNPDVVIGVGGYASGPILKVASFASIKTMIQEQNSFPGKTNIILSKSVNKICVAYNGLEKFFPKDKLIFTGNPVRNNMVDIKGKREAGLIHFGLDPDKKTILIVGGSLGARTLNQCIEHSINQFKNHNAQVLWQCGSFYYKNYIEKTDLYKSQGVYINEFIFEMDLAYAVADVIISRAGAMSVSELTLVGKPTILVPSPNVSDDHQTHNAMALVKNNAAILVRDADAKDKLVDTAFHLLNNDEQLANLSSNALKLGVPNSAELIVSEIEKMI
jgi:UDP-N-acetylglucosamine--N-acetylmuramyl-(pentapeptide) pyrophosphoryl-undecaprenol N-acetylglucosamine transferase